MANVVHLKPVKVYHSSPLVAAILTAAEHKGHCLDIAELHLGAPIGYLSELMDGVRKPENISQTFAEEAAEYLGISPLAVKLLAGQIKARDFMLPSQSDKALDEELKAQAADASIGSLMPAQLLDCDPDVKSYVLLLLYNAKGQMTINHNFMPPIFEGLQRAACVCEEAEQSI